MLQIFEQDRALIPFRRDIELRMDNYRRMRYALVQDGNLSDFANAHKYYGFHHTLDGWVYREWAPAADALYLMGDFNDWNRTSHPLTRLEDGNWELRLPEEALHDGSRVRTVVRNGDTLTDHIPLYARRVVQDPVSFDWLCEVWDPTEAYPWTDRNFHPDAIPLIYESHVGMATEEYRPGTYREFADNVLPRVKDLGYNTVQLMAVMEHPYYGSFGYQVSSFSPLPAASAIPRISSTWSTAPMNSASPSCSIWYTLTPSRTPSRASTCLTARSISSSTPGRRANTPPGGPSASIMESPRCSISCSRT